MQGGSSSGVSDMDKQKDGKKVGPSQPKLEPFVPRKGHDPRELRSWAKRTGFVSTFSGETGTDLSEMDPNERRADIRRLDLEKGHERNGSTSPKIEIDPVLGRAKNRETEIEPVFGTPNILPQKYDGVLGLRDGTARVENKSYGVASLLGIKDDEKKAGLNVNENEIRNRNDNGFVNNNLNGVPAAAEVEEPKKEDENIGGHTAINVYPDDEYDPEGWPQSSKLTCGLRENPGFVLLIYYGLQHYLSLAGSLIFIPLIIVPSMGGSDKDMAAIISTMLLVSGVTTILHSFFGTRLPLVQGSSFVYLAPALAIMNSQEFRNLSEHKFRHIMRELQGAIIIGSVFHSILGFSGLVSLFVR